MEMGIVCEAICVKEGECFAVTFCLSHPSHSKVMLADSVDEKSGKEDGKNNRDEAIGRCTFFPCMIATSIFSSSP